MSKTRTWTVQVPIAGHAIIEVEAESEDAAIEAALNSNDLTMDKIETWEAIESFNQGNICYCPHPWQATAELAFGEDPLDDGEEAP